MRSDFSLNSASVAVPISTGGADDEKIKNVFALKLSLCSWTAILNILLRKNCFLISFFFVKVSVQDIYRHASGIICWHVCSLRSSRV